MSHQEQTNTGSPNGTYIGILPNGDLCVGTKPPVGGFATDGEAVMEELPVGGFAGEAGIEEQLNPLSNLPQSLHECVGNQMWKLSKTCVACGEREYGGAVTSNILLFHRFGCNFIRACAKHHAMVSAHFAKPEFNNIESIQNMCSQCGGEIFSDRGGLCKACAGNWLDRI